MLAQWCLTAWNIAIGRPNCRRSFAYALAVSTHSWAPPAASARGERPRELLRESERTAQHARSADAGVRDRHVADTTRGVEAGLYGSRRRPQRGDDHHVVAGTEHEHIGEPGSEHEPGVAGEVAVGVELQRATEPDRSGLRTVDERREERDRCAPSPARSMSPDAMTVPRNGPGATERPSSSSTTASSGNP